MNRSAKPRTIVALFAMAVFWAPCAAAAADTPVKSVFDTLSGSEPSHLKASGGDAERHGRDLTIWLSGYGDHERGLIFRNWVRKAGPDAEADGDSFVYYGKTPYAHLVEEMLTHDAPMLHLIETGGREHRFHMGEETPYLTASAQHILSIGDVEIATANGVDRPMLFHLLGLHVASGITEGYQDELTCNIYQDRPDLTADPVLLTDDAVMLRIGSGKQALGTIALKRDGWRWLMSAPPSIMSVVTCSAARHP
jgi:hypothetical protein